jgi:hypothetical protein
MNQDELAEFWANETIMANQREIHEPKPCPYCGYGGWPRREERAAMTAPTRGGTMKVFRAYRPGFNKRVSYMPEFGQLSLRVWRWWWVGLMWSWRGER